MPCRFIFVYIEKVYCVSLSLHWFSSHKFPFLCPILILFFCLNKNTWMYCMLYIFVEYSNSWMGHTYSASILYETTWVFTKGECICFICIYISFLISDILEKSFTYRLNMWIECTFRKMQDLGLLKISWGVVFSYF